ncbi:MAG: ABC-2 family transporter protein [Clostridia bacterium]|nr:ABC-2 family transporter protein [Clostridia bacterium]
MFTEVKTHLKLILKYFTFNLSALTEYRTSFLVQVFGMALNNASFAFFWWVLFDRLGTGIGGYGFTDVMFLWAVASTGFGLSHVFFANANRISGMIITGELDTYLLQPKNPLINSISARMSVTAWGDVIYGIVLMALIKASGMMWVMFGISIFTAALLITSIAVAGHSLTFYFGNMEAVGRTLWEFTITFSIYPETIFKGPVKALIMTAVPIGFITHVPLRLVRNFSWGTLLLLFGVTLAYALFAFILYMKGLRKYESGNLIVTRM